MLQTPPVRIGVVIILKPEDRQQFQTQAEKQVRYQSYPVSKIRYAQSEEDIKKGEKSLDGQVDRVFVMDGTGYYARDFIETCLMFPEGAFPYRVTWSRTDKKCSTEKLKEIMRTEYPFFERVYGF